MRASILAVLLAALLASCVPASVDEAPAPGVTLTATRTEDFTVFRLATGEPLDLVLLRFQGIALEANAPECRETAVALECSVGPVSSFYEVAVSGAVTNLPDRPLGVACADGECSAVYLSDSE